MNQLLDVDWDLIEKEEKLKDARQYRAIRNATEWDAGILDERLWNKNRKFIKAYKGFDYDLKKDGIQFEIGKEYEYYGDFPEHLFDDENEWGGTETTIDDHYGFYFTTSRDFIEEDNTKVENSRYCEIELTEDYAVDEPVCWFGVAKKIKIIREITQEILTERFDNHEWITVATNSYSLPEHLAEIGKCDNIYLKELVAVNPNTPLSTIKDLCNDESILVSTLAKCSFEKKFKQ